MPGRFTWRRDQRLGAGWVGRLHGRLRAASHWGDVSRARTADLDDQAGGRPQQRSAPSRPAAKTCLPHENRHCGHSSPGGSPTTGRPSRSPASCQGAGHRGLRRGTSGVARGDLQDVFVQTRGALSKELQEHQRSDGRRGATCNTVTGQWRPQTRRRPLDWAAARRGRRSRRAGRRKEGDMLLGRGLPQSATGPPRNHRAEAVARRPRPSAARSSTTVIGGHETALRQDARYSAIPST